MPPRPALLASRCTALALALALVLAACTTSGPTRRYDAPDEIPEGATADQRQVRALKLLRQAQSAMVNGQLDEATALFEKALAIYRDAGDLSAQAAVHSDMALIANAQGDNTRALKLLDTAIELGQQGDTPTVTIEALYNKGIVLYDLKRDKEAEDTFALTVQYAKANRNAELLGLALNALGNVRRRNNNLAPAIDAYKGALLAWNELRRPKHAAVALQNIAYCHVLRDEPDEAAAALQQAVDALAPTSGPDRDLLLPHLEELLRLVRADKEAARKKVLKVLGR